MPILASPCDQKCMVAGPWGPKCIEPPLGPKMYEGHHLGKKMYGSRPCGQICVGLCRPAIVTRSVAYRGIVASNWGPKCWPIEPALNWDHGHPLLQEMFGRRPCGQIVCWTALVTRNVW